MSGRLALWVAVGALVFIGLLPVALMLVESISSGGSLSLVHYRELAGHTSAWRLMVKTLLLASLTSLFSMALGMPLGLLFGKTDLPLRVPLAALFTLPLLLPPYVVAISWFRVFGRTGALSHVAGASFGESASALFVGLPGCLWVLTLTFAPVPMLLTIVSLKAVPARLEEAGRLAGDWALVLRRISLPLAVPGILFGGILAFVMAAGEFTVPQYLRYDTFPVLSFTRFSASYDFAAATAAAAPMAMVVLVIIAIEARYVKGDQAPSRASGANNLSFPLGRYRWPAFVAAGTFVCGAVLAPLAILLSGAQITDIGRAYSESRFSLFRGLLYSGVSAGALTILGFVLAWGVQRRALSSGPAVGFASLFLFALPPTVLGIGLIHLWNRGVLNAFYGSPAMLVFGYIAQYAGLAVRLIRP
ncbi:MAG: iron(III) transport system permease protein, partial [Bryobacterales bacterium]|nr:iron(III) transport system permease protein [Bryobacterales bacterium]